MFKLTLPERDDFYRELVKDPRVLKVVALSGGYSREEATTRLARNPSVVANFSRAHRGPEVWPKRCRVRPCSRRGDT